MATMDVCSILTSILWRSTTSDGCLPCYALLDAARHSSIHPTLLTSDLERTCLHESDCAPDIEQVGAHLVSLEQGHSFAEWVLTKGWGNSWGIFLRSHADYQALSEHLRQFLKAQTPEGNEVLFRFYDPRVLRVFLPTCAPDELRSFFGPIREIVLEDEQQGRLLRFTCLEHGLVKEVVELVGGDRE